MLSGVKMMKFVKLLLLTLTVAVVSLLNNRQVATWQRFAPASAQTEAGRQLNKATAQKRTIVYQKVSLEATHALEALQLAVLTFAALLLLPLVWPAAAKPLFTQAYGFLPYRARLFRTCIQAQAP